VELIKQLEASLEDIFVKKAPTLPANTKKTLVQYLPWINLALGIISLWAAYTLWHWAHWANRITDYSNSLSAIYGGPVPVTSRLSAAVWLSLAVLAIEAVIYLVAFSPLRALKRRGWNLLFYAMLINVLYSLIVMFTNYGGMTSFLTGLISTIIGLYFLFQLKSQYQGKDTATSQSPLLLRAKQY
jgi:hypothetical protein